MSIIQYAGALASQSNGYDSDAQAYFSRMVVNPGSIVKSAVNRAVLDLKACGYWSKLDFLQLVCLNTSQQSFLDLKRPTKQGAIYGSAAFIANVGVHGSLSGTSYYDTDFTDSVDGVNFTLNDNAFFLFVRDKAASAGAYASFGGASGGSNNTSIGEYMAAGEVWGNAVSTTNLVSSAGASANQVLYVHNRVSSSDVKLYKAGSVIASGSHAPSAFAGFPIYVGATNGSGTLFWQNDANISIVGAGGSMSSGQITTVTNIFNTLLTDLSVIP